jgi:hypothetical protein
MNAQHRIGLVLLGLLAVGDLATPFVTDGETPPMWVALISLALGLASLACLPAAWRGRRPALLGLFGTRLLSAVLAIPAFFVDDVPGDVAALVGVTVALTVVGVVLVLAGTRRAVPA